MMFSVMAVTVGDLGQSSKEMLTPGASFVTADVDWTRSSVHSKPEVSPSAAAGVTTSRQIDAKVTNRQLWYPSIESKNLWNSSFEYEASKVWYPSTESLTLRSSSSESQYLVLNPGTISK